MRLVSIFALAAGLAAIAATASTPVTADGVQAKRPGKVLLRRHAEPRFAHVFNRYGYPATAEDPWAYSYEPRGYYPYYNSNQWRPHAEMRYRYRYDFALGDYYSSWGYPIVCHTRDRQACAEALRLRRRW